MERGRVHEKAKYSILVENFIRRYIMSKIYYVEDILCRKAICLLQREPEN